MGHARSGWRAPNVGLSVRLAVKKSRNRSTTRSLAAATIAGTGSVAAGSMTATTVISGNPFLGVSVSCMGSRSPWVPTGGAVILKLGGGDF
jgi:hypothetical protein